MFEPLQEIQKIAIVGGTGKEGKGLAYRWAKAGYQVIIGSRTVEKANLVASEISLLLPTAAVTGVENLTAVQQADLVVLTVPFPVHISTLELIREGLIGKILIDVTVPLVPPKVTRVQMPSAGSAAQEAQLFLGPEVQVVAAFQNISYEHLLDDEEVNCDVLVCGGNKDARKIVLRLVERAGLNGWDAGPIENSVVVEGMTSVLIGINKQYNVQSAGIRITGVPRTAQQPEV
jgi:NADPH-dependent F420 reductase